jgi:hypothetical protein
MKNLVTKQGRMQPGMAFLLFLVRNLYISSTPAGTRICFDHVFKALSKEMASNDDGQDRDSNLMHGEKNQTCVVRKRPWAFEVTLLREWRDSRYFQCSSERK